MKQGGVIANFTGNRLEKFINDLLLDEGYVFISREEFETCKKDFNEKIYTRQFCIGESIYHTKLKTDFILHSEKFPECLLIEAKWQQGGGSVDEKYPYLVLNLKSTEYTSIIVIDGGGYRANALAWLKSQTDNKLIYVFNMSDFQKWINNGNL